MPYVILFMLLVGVVLVVTSPLRRSPLSAQDASEHARATREAAERASTLVDLEAARDAKYREIRDAELDHQTGKLSDADYAAVDSTLRAEAIELLRHLDELDRSEGEGEGDDAEAGDE
jgi:hypothetical protein